MEEQLIGKKDLFRAIISFRVLDVIELSGSLVTCLNLGCPMPKLTYSEFIDGFHKLYLQTSLSTNNPELLEEIEDLFYENRDGSGWRYESEEDFREMAWLFIDSFKLYMVQLKKDGLYNPEISRRLADFDDSWRESIG